MAKKYKPIPQVIRTPLDEHGSILDMERIPGEDLGSYAERLMDTYTNRSSSEYEGLINGVNRELNLRKENLFKVLIRGIGFGSLSNPNIIKTQTTITNNLFYSNTIDGAGVTATGAKLSDSTMLWEPKHLRGFKLTIQSVDYEVIDNTETELMINGNLSGLVGQVYTLSPKWEENSLIGLGLEMDGVKYRIIENTANTLAIEAGDLLLNAGTEYKIRAFNPMVEVTASKFILYKEYDNKGNFQKEKEIDLRRDVRFYNEIVKEINKLIFFEATDELKAENEVFSISLKRQKSEKSILREVVPAASFFRMKNNRIKEGSIRFSEANIFLREVGEGESSQKQGNYTVDYNKGAVIVNGTPSGNQTVSYKWNDFPFMIKSSPAIINAFNKEDSKEFLFLQKEMKRYNSSAERFKSSIPKADMIEYMSELLGVKPENWGE